MREYLAKRIVIAIFILYIIASLNFVIFQVLAPLDPTATIIDPHFTKEMKDMMKAQFGLFEPLHVRYTKYITNMFTWRFGFSFVSLAPVSEEMSWRLRNTLLLMGTALITTMLVGLPLGILAASKRGSKADVAVIGSGLLTWGVPTFFIQLISLLLLSYYTYVWFGFSLLPLRGMISTPPPSNPIGYIADVAWHLAQPVLTLTVAGFGSWALYIRNIMVEALTQDYIVTARAKGLSERAVLYRHAFKSVLPPIATIIALAVPGLVLGAMITEYIFTWPGIGQWYLSAMLGGDYPVVQAVFFIYAFLMILANLISDILYGVLDPRIRVGVRR